MAAVQTFLQRMGFHHVLAVGQCNFDYVTLSLPHKSNCKQTSGTTESNYHQLLIKNNKLAVRLFAPEA